MKETLAPGIDLEKKYAVTKDMAPPHLPMPVISTPSMRRIPCVVAVPRASSNPSSVS